MLLPCEDNLLRNLTIDRPAMRVSRYESLPCDIEKGLLEIIENEISFMQRIELIKKELESRVDYTSMPAYRSIDKYNDGYITIFNLGSFLRSCGHHATEK